MSFLVIQKGRLGAEPSDVSTDWSACRQNAQQKQILLTGYLLKDIFESWAHVWVFDSVSPHPLPSAVQSGPLLAKASLIGNCLGNGRCWLLGFGRCYAVVWIDW